MSYTPQSGGDVVLYFDLDTYAPQTANDTILLFGEDTEANDYLYTYWLAI